MNFFILKNTISHVKGNTLLNQIDINTALMFRNAVQSHPDRVMVNSYQQKLTLSYQQVFQKSRTLAAGLVALGLKPRDRVGIMSYNRIQWLYAQMASSMANLILVNINPAYLQNQLLFCINKVQISALFIDHVYHKHNYIDLLFKLIPQLQTNQQLNLLPHKKLPSLKHIICMDPNYKETNNIKAFDNLLHQGQEQKKKIDDLIGKINPDQPTNIQFTSGTTGFPKGATLSHRNILNNGYSLGQRPKYGIEDKICVSVPLYHCFGMVIGNLAALTRGISVVYPCRGFNAQKSLLASQLYGATSIYGVPTMFIQYIKQAKKKKYNLKLRTGIMAGSLCPQKLMLQAQEILKIKELTICYGMTQTSPVSFQTCPTDSLQNKTQTVGTILPGIQAKIVDQKGNILENGQPGQFWVKGYCVMSGYWGDQQKTKQVIYDGWMKSGDLGEIDQKGYLRIVGRIKDMIIRGGQNVYPKQIEAHLRQLKEIQDAQVIGVPDQRMGEQIAAILTVRDNYKISKQQVYQHCYGQIAHYKSPKYVKFVDKYPLTVTGKVQKYILRQEFAKQITEGKAQLYKVKH